MPELTSATPASPHPPASEPDVLVVNGRRFLKAPRKRTGTPLDPVPGMDGWYKPSGKGVQLLAPDGSPMAYACANGGGFLVSTHLWQGKVRYLHSLTERDKKALRITGYLQGIETAQTILKHVHKGA